MKNYYRYLNSLKKPLLISDKEEANTPMPDPLPENDERPAMCAYLNMASLLSKKVAEETRDRLSNLLKAEEYYKEIKQYCQRNPNCADKVKAELETCEEMLNLMHVKLETVRRQ